MSRPTSAPSGFLARSWRWFRDQSGPIQTLIAIFALAVAIASLLVAIEALPDDDGPLPPPPSSSAPAQSRLKTVSSTVDGVPGDGDSGRPSISGDGRYVAFTSAATNLDDSAPPARYDIFRKDLVTGELILISGTPDGAPGNGDSQFPSICRDGRFVAFASSSTDLLADGPSVVGERLRVYVHDTLDGRTTLVSAGVGGEDGDGDSRSPSLSADCRSVAFESESTNLTTSGRVEGNQVYVRDLIGDATVIASADRNGIALGLGSFAADLSPAGNRVAFSTALRETAGPQGDRYAVHVRDLDSGAVTSISESFRHSSPDGTGFAWPNFSPDGRLIAFRSLNEPNPMIIGPDVFVWDIGERAGAIPGADGEPTGWNNACTDGVNNGTRFSPGLSGDGSAARPYRIIFPAERDGDCRLVFRDFSNNDTPIDLGRPLAETIEPAVNASGDVVAWVATQPQPWQVLACGLEESGESGAVTSSCRR